ncbi:MAG: hypothetical protein KKF62_19555, partial [Bacteroidetes bacterium]|nr:hypothetical protein [Bacteroidota bacterium]
MAQNANTRKFSVEDVLGIYDVVMKQGKGLSYERFNQAAKIMNLARNKTIGKEKQGSLFGDAKTSERLAKGLNKIEEEKNRAKRIVKNVKQQNKLGKDLGIAVTTDWQRASAEAQGTINKIEKNEIDSLVESWGGKKDSNVDHLNRVIKNGEDVSKKLESDNTQKDKTINKKADDVKYDAKQAQVSYGRQQEQVDLTEYDKMMSAISLDAPVMERTKLVLEAEAKKDEIMTNAGFEFVDNEWKKLDGKKPANAVEVKEATPATRSNLQERIDYTTETGMSEEIIKAIDSMTVNGEKVNEKVDETIKNEPEKWEKIKNGFNGVLKAVGSPMLRLPEMWRKILLPMEYFRGFIDKQTNELINAYGGIKRGSQSDLRIKRLKDGRATQEDIDKVTDKELKVLNNLDRLTNRWLDLQKKKFPVIIARFKEIFSELEKEFNDKSGFVLEDILPEDGVLSFAERKEDDARVSMEMSALREYDIENGTNLISLYSQAVNVRRELAKTELGLYNLTEKAEQFYMPRVPIKNKNELQVNDSKRKRVNKYLFRSLQARETELNEADNASGFDLLEKYIKGMGYELHLRPMYVEATLEMEKYTGNKLREGREYLEYMKNPSNVSAISLILTRGFASSQLGIRTQGKNLAHGQALIFAETGHHHLRALNMIGKDLKKFRNILHENYDGTDIVDELNKLNKERSKAKKAKNNKKVEEIDNKISDLNEKYPQLNFLQDVEREILGMIGASGMEKMSMRWKKVQGKLPSAQLMKAVESINRPLAYVAGYLQGEARGLTGEDLYFHAWNTVAKTQFIYGTHATPKAFRGKYSRIASQYVLTRIRDMEQLMSRVTAI